MPEEWRVKAAPSDPIKARRDVEELRRYFRSSYKHGALYGLILTLGANFGLRAGDLLALRVGDMRGKTHLEIKEQKTQKTRRMFINGRARAEFDAYVGRYIFIVDDSRIFSGQKGYVITVKSLHRLIRDGCREIGLEGNFGSHTLRKTFAYHAYAYTRNLRAISRILGHSSLAVTKLYIDADEDAEEYSRSDDEIYSSLNL